MLILTRSIGQRIRINDPNGSYIWLTMGDRSVHVDAHGLPVGDMADGGAKIFMPNGDTIIAKWMKHSIHSVAKTGLNRPGIGILAPREYGITREELLEDLQD